MISERQEKLLNFLIKEYINTTEPVSSFALKKVTDLDVCGATIRNDLQELTKQGFIEQPHTSAGRIPTKKAYRYFSEKYFPENFITQQIRLAHQEMEREMQQMQELMQTLENDNMFEILITIETWHKKNQN